MLKFFNSLPLQEKVDFFVKCQELLLKHHPDSPFVIREDKLEEALEACHNNIEQYKGYYYTDDNVCVLWNHVKINDPNDVKRAVMENAYKMPNPEFNAVSIDFAVFREIKDCIEFIQANKNNLIQYVLFIRGGNPRIYQIDSLLKGIGV